MTLITVIEQQAALQPILAAVSGLKTVSVEFPDALQSRELPALILRPREAVYDQHTRGAVSLLMRRRWEGLLFVRPADEGREYQAENEVKPFLTAIPLALAAYPTIRLADGRAFTVKLDGDRDSGPLNASYNGSKPYSGAVFSFTTECEARIAPA